MTTTSYTRWQLDPDVPLGTKSFVVVRVTTTYERIGGPFSSVRAAEKFIAEHAVGERQGVLL